MKIIEVRVSGVRRGGIEMTQVVIAATEGLTRATGQGLGFTFDEAREAALAKVTERLEAADTAASWSAMPQVHRERKAVSHLASKPADSDQ